MRPLLVKSVLELKEGTMVSQRYAILRYLGSVSFRFSMLSDWTLLTEKLIKQHGKVRSYHASIEVIM